jgi:hypothetical protein
MPLTPKCLTCGDWHFNAVARNSSPLAHSHQTSTSTLTGRWTDIKAPR